MIRRLLLFMGIGIVVNIPSYLFGYTGGELLLLDKGARASALSGAISASFEKDAFGFDYNPAMLGFQSNWLIGFEHNQWIAQMQGDYLSTAYPLPLGGVGLALDYFSYGVMESIDDQGYLKDQTFTPYALDMKAAYGLKIQNRLSLGAQLEYYREHIENFTDSGLGFSFGSLWQSPWKGTAFGLSLHDIGMTGSGYALPGNAVLGCSWNEAFIKELTVYLDSTFYWVDTAVDISTALEYQPVSWLSLRLGYGRYVSGFLTSQSGLTGGLALKWQNWQVSYAFIPIGEFGLNHRFSLEYALDLDVKKKSEPSIALQLQAETTKIQEVKTSDKDESVKPDDAKLKKQMEAVIRKRLDLGTKQYQAGNYKMAIHEWKMVLDLEPNHALAKTKIQKAENEWEDKVEQYRQKARKAKTTQDLITEIQSWKNALALMPEDKEAENELKRAEQLAPALIQSLYNRGLEDYSKANYKDAVQKWEKILILNPRHYKALENIQKTKEKLIRIE